MFWKGVNTSNTNLPYRNIQKVKYKTVRKQGQTECNGADKFETFEKISESLLVSVRLPALLPSSSPLQLTCSSPQDGSDYSLDTVRLHQAFRQQLAT